MLENNLLDSRVFEKKQHIFMPGVSGNPLGRPQNFGSITYWIKQLLAENEGAKAVELASKIISQANSGSLPHQTLLLERVDGNVASEINVKGVFLHVGDEYASQGLAAMREDMTTKQLEASQMPQISNSSPTNGQTGIQLPPAGNDPIKIDE